MAHAADHLGGSPKPGGGDDGGAYGDGEFQDMECLAVAQGVMMTFASVRSAIYHCFQIAHEIDSDVGMAGLTSHRTCRRAPGLGYTGYIKLLVWVCV